MKVRVKYLLVPLLQQLLTLMLGHDVCIAVVGARHGRTGQRQQAEQRLPGRHAGVSGESGLEEKKKNGTQSILIEQVHFLTFPIQRVGVVYREGRIDWGPSPLANLQSPIRRRKVVQTFPSWCPDILDFIYFGVFHTSTLCWVLHRN